MIILKKEKKDKEKIESISIKNQENENENKSLLDDLMEKTELDFTTNQILMFLLQDKDIELKSDIENVRNFTSLEVLKIYLDSIGLKLSSTLLEIFINKYLRFRVSNKRKSRKEIIDALKHIIDKNENESIGTSKLLTSNLLE